TERSSYSFITSNTGGGRLSSYAFTMSNITGGPVYHSFTTSNTGGGRRSSFIHSVEYGGGDSSFIYKIDYRKVGVHHSLQGIEYREEADLNGRRPTFMFIVHEYGRRPAFIICIYNVEYQRREPALSFIPQHQIPREAERSSFITTLNAERGRCSYAFTTLNAGEADVPHSFTASNGGGRRSSFIYNVEY
ncbi:hypothetical protein HAX54_045936, partial [Datura stramonium]|nr:hypothetical protein [Datura stramonium]